MVPGWPVRNCFSDDGCRSLECRCLQGGSYLLKGYKIQAACRLLWTSRTQKARRLLFLPPTLSSNWSHVEFILLCFRSWSIFLQRWCCLWWESSAFSTHFWSTFILLPRGSRLKPAKRQLSWYCRGPGWRLTFLRPTRTRRGSDSPNRVSFRYQHWINWRRGRRRRWSVRKSRTGSNSKDRTWILKIYFYRESFRKSRSDSASTEIWQIQ